VSAVLWRKSGRSQGTHLCLIDAGNFILDGIFDGKNVARKLVDFGERRGKRHPIHENENARRRGAAGPCPHGGHTRAHPIISREAGLSLGRGLKSEPHWAAAMACLASDSPIGVKSIGPWRSLKVAAAATRPPRGEIAVKPLMLLTLSFRLALK
jgi:hypothetical protein